MKRFLFLFILFLSFFNIYSADYYVSSSGTDNGSCGSEGSPCQTIQYALDNKVGAGDTLYIRGGTYRETITIDEDGSIGNVITIQNYPNEVVTIDGTVDISGTWSTYGSVSGSYQLSYSGNNDITQLFVDDVPMVNARWPNAQFNDDSIFSHSSWAQGDEGDDDNPNSVQGSLQIDEDIYNPGSLDLNNSIGILNIGSFKTETVKITGHTQNAGADDVITYGYTGGTDADYSTTYKDKHHYYFFEGKLAFMDTNNEWFHDKTNHILYLYPDDGLNPSTTGRTIKAKTTDYRVTFSGANYITFKGINFFATTIDVQNSDNLSIEECNFYFPSASKRMLGLTNGLGSTNVTSLNNTSDNNIIKKCLFENTEGEALVIKGDSNEIENNYFHHIDWSASDLNGLMVTMYCTGDSNTFTKNTIHTTGASATVLPGTSSTFSYNKVTNTGLLQSDGAVFQGTKNYVEGSNVHHNFIYDTEKYAFRYDAPGGDAAVAGSYGRMHHNVADNTNGLMIKGNNQIIAHNTVMNTINNRNDIIILAEDCSNTSTWLYNNLAKRIGSHRSSQSFSLSADSPMPMGTIGYIEYNNGSDDLWRTCVDNDVSNGWTATVGNGSSQDNIDQINVLRTGLDYNSDIESLLNYNAANGKSEADYVPTNNVTLVNAGISPTTTVNTGASTTSTLNLLVPHTNVSSAADIGAFEYGGTVWTAGIDWTPKFHTTIWKKDAATTDWNTTSNWSTGYVPTSDVHVIIPANDNSRYPEISNTGAAAKNITVNTSATLTIDKEGDLTLSGNLVNRGTITLNSDSNEFSSLIVQGTSSGNITYNRYVNATDGGDEGWDLIGSPVDGQAVSGFATTNIAGTATLATNGSGQYAIGVYDNSVASGHSDEWVNYTNSGSGWQAGNFVKGKGYAMASVSGGTGLLAFTGTVDTDATETIAIEDHSDGSGTVWNLIANPYPSFITIGPTSTTDTFLEVNEDVIDDTYVGVYGYDAETSNDSRIYDPYNNTTNAKMAPGQGFMVAARSTTSANITFKEEMQTTSTGDDFISGDALNDSYEVLLKLYYEDNVKGQTKLYFKDILTLGLDKGWDAGAFNQNAAIMTRLVEEDEGHGLAINAMSTDHMNNISIPLVINNLNGIEFRVNLHTSTIGEVNIYLEDAELSTLTLLNEEDFVLTPTSDLSDAGRFYIHLTADTLSDGEVNTSLLNAYKKVDSNYITIEGLSTQSTSTQVSLFNILGAKVMDATLDNTSNTQMISTNGLSTGIYVIKLESGQNQLAKKLIIH